VFFKDNEEHFTFSSTITSCPVVWRINYETQKLKMSFFVLIAFLKSEYVTSSLVFATCMHPRAAPVLDHYCHVPSQEDKLAAKPVTILIVLVEGKLRKSCIRLVKLVTD